MAGRKKLTDEQRAEIIRLYNEDKLSYKNIAALFDVNWRTISRIINPEAYEEEKKRNVEYNKKNSKQIIANQKKNTRSYHLRFTQSTEGDVIEHLDSKENLNGYLKDIIRQDMAKNPIQTKNNKEEKK